MFEYFLTFIVSIILICAAIGWAFVFALGIPQYLKFYFFFLKNKETENIIPIPKLYESNKINYIISMIIGLLIIIMGFFMQILYPPIFTVFGVAIIVLNLDLLIGSIIGTRPLLNLKIFAIPMNSFIKFIFRLIKGSSIFSVFLSCFGLVIIIFKYIFNVNIIDQIDPLWGALHLLCTFLFFKIIIRPLYFLGHGSISCFFEKNTLIEIDPNTSSSAAKVDTNEIFNKAFEQFKKEKDLNNSKK